MQASDIMTQDVITVGPDTPVAEIVRTMLDHRISAVPVARDGALVGIISEGDLLRRVETGTERHRSRWLEFATSAPTLAAEYVRSHGRTASELMTADVVSVEHDAPIAKVAEILESRRIKRVPVLQDGRLVGIVSRANLIQALASTLGAEGGGVQNDKQIRDALLAEIRKHKWVPSSTDTNVIVSDGCVHLWGFIRAESERKAMIVAAENIPGVRRVEDHMDYPPIYIGF
jgi:CBS domain-containing protein